MRQQRQNRRFFTVRGLTFLGLGVLLVTLALPAVASGAAPTPGVVLSETGHEFGEVFEDRQLSHTFVVKNRGDAPVEILKVDPDCACTVPSYDRTITPGGQGEITLTLKPYSVMRQFRKETRIFTNDREHPEFSLVLTGTAKPFIEIEPSHIVRLRGAPGDNLQGQVRFISHLPGPFKITDYRTNIPDKIEVNLKAVEADRVYVLEVKNKSRNSGPYAGLIELTTTSQQRPRLIVRVFGEIYLPSSAGQ